MVHYCLPSGVRVLQFEFVPDLGVVENDASQVQIVFTVTILERALAVTVHSVESIPGILCK